MKLRILSTARLSFPLASALAALLSAQSAMAADGTWVGASGDWTNPATWSGGTLADGAGFTANFTGVDVAADQTITLAADRTIGNITFTDATTSSNNLLITGANFLTLDVASGAPVIDVTQSVRTLTINSQIVGNDGLQKIGTGALTLNGSGVNTFIGGLTISRGTLTLDYANLAAPINLVDATNALQINNGALTITGQNLAAATTAQTFASTSLGAGVNTVNIAKGALATSATLNLGALTVASGSSTTFSPTTAWTTTASTTERVFISAGGSVPSLPAGATTAFVNAGVFHRVAGGVTAGTLRLAAVNSSGQLLLKANAGNLAVGTGVDPTGSYQLNAGSIALTNTGASIYGLLLNATGAGTNITIANSGTLTLNSVIQIKTTESVNIVAGTGVSNVIIGSEKNLVIAMDNAAGVAISAPIANNGSTGGVGGTASAVTIVGTNPAAGPGAVTLSGANTYSGPTTITRGTLALGNVNALQNTSGITLGGTSGATLQNSGDITGISIAAPITVANSGVNSTISYSRTTAAVGSLTLNGAIGGAGNVIFTTPNASSGGNLQTINLGAAATYAGNTTITAGNNNNATSIRNTSGAANVLPITTVLTLSGGSGTGSGRSVTFDLNGQNQELAGLTNSISSLTARNQRVTSGSAATLTINGSANSTYGGLGVPSSFNGSAVNPSAQIAGAISLTKNGTGTFTLAAGAGNPFTGATKILGGILSLGHPTSIQSSAFDTTNSILGDATNGLQTAVTTLTLGGLTGSNNFASRFITGGGYTGLTDLTLNPPSGVTHTYAADIGDGATGMNLIKTGAGTQVLTAAQTYTGTTTGTAGALITSSAAAMPGYNVAGKVIFNGGTIGVQVGGGGWTTGEVDTLLANATKTSGALGIDTTNGNLVQWTAFNTTNFGALGLNKLGANDLTLNQANTFTGATTVTEGTLTLTNANALQNSALVTTGAGTLVLSGVTTLNLAGLSGATGDLATIITGYSGVTDLTLNVPAGALLSYSGNIGEGAPGMTVTKTGLGIQALSGINSYTGATQINDGMLVFRNKASKAVAVATAAAAGSIGLGVKTADAAFYSAGEVGDLFNTNTLPGFSLDAASGVAIDTTAASFDQTVALTAARSLTKLGANTLTLSTGNTYSGATTVNAGALSVTNNDSLGTTAGATTIIGGNGTAGSTLTLTDATSDLTVAEAINFNGNTVGRARLSNNSAFNHTLGGAINVDSDTNIVEFNSTGAGSITLSGDITGNFTGIAPLSLLLRGTSTSATNLLTGNVTLTGNGFLAKTDTGTWTIGAVGKTISAPSLSVVNGILKLGAADVLVNAMVLEMGATTGGSTGSFDLNGFNETIGGISQLGASGAKTITNSGAAAVLTVNNATNYSTGSLVALTGSLGLTKQGVGTLTLDGANSYNGNTIVSAGTLALADNAQLKFVISGPGTNNSLTGPGTATLDGDFVIDTTAVDALSSGTWTLENVDNLTGGAYGANFTVVGFVDAGGNTWTKANGLTKRYTFDEATGVLKLETLGYAAWATLNGASLNLNDDHDSDGVNNGTEYFIGGPSGNTTGFTPLPGVINTLGVLSVTWTKAASYTGTYGTDFSVETSATLTGVWATEPSPGTVTISGNDVTYTFPPGTINFARLKVTGP